MPMDMDLAPQVYRDHQRPGYPFRLVRLWQPAWCNCLIWANHHYRLYGGYVLKRPSVVSWRWHRNGKDHPAFWPHAMWSPDGETCFEFTTTKPAYLPWYRLFTMLLFRGHVARVTRQWL